MGKKSNTLGKIKDALKGGDKKKQSKDAKPKSDKKTNATDKKKATGSGSSSKAEPLSKKEQAPVASAEVHDHVSDTRSSKERRQNWFKRPSHRNTRRSK